MNATFRSVRWAVVISRALHPTKAWILEALETEGAPLSATDLYKIRAVHNKGVTLEKISYHLGKLAETGVLVEVQSPSRESGNARRTYYDFAEGILSED